MIRRKNCVPSSALRNSPEQCFDLWLPATNSAAIISNAISGTTTAAGVKPIAGTGIFSGGELPFPAMLIFTCGTATDQFTYEIDGVDHVGNTIRGYRNVKNNANAQTGTMVGTNPRAICWSKITRFEIIGGATTGTLDVGFAYGTTNGLLPRIPLPFKVNQIADIAGIQFVSAGGSVFASPPPANLVLTSLLEGGNVLQTSFGAQTTAPSTPMGFRLCMKTGIYMPAEASAYQ